LKIVPVPTSRPLIRIEKLLME